MCVCQVPDCIKKCQNSGISVRMVTGDNVETARAIALKCGIITRGDGSLVLEGTEFNKKVTDANGEVRTLGVAGMAWWRRS